MSLIEPIAAAAAIPVATPRDVARRTCVVPAAFVRRHALALIVAGALAIRLALLAGAPRSYFPDEIFQYLEAAHRLAFGPAVVPWEYRAGIRSWLLPLLLAGPMAVGGWLAPLGPAYLVAAKLVPVLLSLATVVAGVSIGNRVSPRHGLFAGAALAIWSETALFATQALTEAVAVPLILGGAALLLDRDATARRLVAAGALLALGVVLRFQYGPAVAVLGAIACGVDRRRWAWAASGSAVALIAAGAIDLAMGQRPFGWILENVHQNITLGRSHAWTDGPFFYPLMIAAAFGVALLPAWMLARRVAARFPALALCAIVNVAAHTLIAHKEYRYILLSTTILVLLAAIGTVDWIEAAARGARGRRWAVALAGWIGCSLLAATTGFPTRAWTRVTPELRAFAALRDGPPLCGVAIVGDYWADSGGYAYLHRAVPIYVPDDDGAAPRSWVPRSSAAFDAIMAPARLGSALPPAYHRETCFGGGRACVFRRSGGCDARAGTDHEINRMLVRTNR